MNLGTIFDYYFSYFLVLQRFNPVQSGKKKNNFRNFLSQFFFFRREIRLSKRDCNLIFYSFSSKQVRVNPNINKTNLEMGL